jgi:hypothetical protein
VGHDGDGGGRKSDGKYDQPQYRRPVVPEIPEGRVVGRIEQYGRDEERQGQLRRNRERGRAGKKREDGAAECEKYRIRCSDAPRRGRKDHRRDEQNEQLFELPHVSQAGRICGLWQLRSPTRCSSSRFSL